MLYPFLREILFQFDPEAVHYFSMNLLKTGCKIAPIKQWITNAYTPTGANNSRELMGLSFKNPVGLGAGFDKNALYLNELAALGFGFVEIGTVTPLPQAGNDKPRLFRLPADKALINRMGFNNDGAKLIRERLEKWQEKKINQSLIVGGNIGKNKVTANEDAWKDYMICFDELFDMVDYFVVNVSSPNTPGLRALQEKDALKKILSELKNKNLSNKHPKPLLLKIAPDLTTGQLDDIISLATELPLDGLVSSNTTLDRTKLSANSQQQAEKIGAGGLSGLPVKTKSTEVLQYLHNSLNGQIPLIASGGIFSAADAKEKFDNGAALIQVWTGFVYEGPGIVKKILG